MTVGGPNEELITWLPRSSAQLYGKCVITVISGSVRLTLLSVPAAWSLSLWSELEKRDSGTRLQPVNPQTNVMAHCILRVAASRSFTTE